jgi:hypothetical protein
MTDEAGDVYELGTSQIGMDFGQIACDIGTISQDVAAVDAASAALDVSGVGTGIDPAARHSERWVQSFRDPAGSPRRTHAGSNQSQPVRPPIMKRSKTAIGWSNGM